MRNLLSITANVANLFRVVTPSVQATTATATGATTGTILTSTDIAVITSTDDAHIVILPDAAVGKVIYLHNITGSSGKIANVLSHATATVKINETASKAYALAKQTSAIAIRRNATNWDLMVCVYPTPAV